MKDRVYRYTYRTTGDDQVYQTRVTVLERGEHEGYVCYIMLPVDVWPHRPGDSRIARAIVMTPEEEHEWKNLDLVPEDGEGDS